MCELVNIMCESLVAQHVTNLRSYDWGKQQYLVVLLLKMAEIRSLTVEDLSIYLQEQGIPSEFCERFEGKNFYF